MAGAAGMLLVIAVLPASGQNLVPNPDFETFTTCPTGIATMQGPMLCTPWTSPTLTTSDYFNSCHVGLVGVPGNGFGEQYAHSGEGYVGILVYSLNINNNWYEYVQVQLTEPLQAGVSYVVSLYYSIADFGCYGNNLGMYLSSGPIGWSGSPDPILEDPQIETGPGLLENKDIWQLLTGCYVAEGGEQWLTIGNFYPAEELMFDSCLAQEWVYFYIDDVVVEEALDQGDLEFSLGEDVQVCTGLVLNVPIDNASYLWQDQSHSQHYNVTVSGLYHVTVTQGCLIGYDSIEVIIDDPVEQIDLGESVVFLCEGNTLVYDFDPDLGDFIWQDGSDSPNYVISAPGLYGVTLSNVCNSTSDQIEVVEVLPLSPIDLGEDMILCPLTTLTLSLDPGLGIFIWQDGSSGSSFTIAEPGIYAVTVSNPCGQVSDEIEIDYLPEVIEFFGSDILELCGGDSAEFHFNPDYGEYFWSNGAVGPDIILDEPGIYSVTLSNMCGNQVASVELQYQYPPVPSLGPDITLCPAQLPFTLDLTGLPNAEMWQWQDGSTAPAFVVTGGGIYSVTVSNGCFNVSDAVQITIENTGTVVNLPADTVLCPGDVLHLDVGALPGSYMWQDSSQGAGYDVTQSGTYSVTVSNVCGDDSDDIVVDYFDPLTGLNLGPDLNLCPGESVIINAGVTGVDYLWQDGSMGPSLTVDTAGTIILTIFDGCTSVSDTVIVNLNGTGPDAGLPDMAGLCAGNSITISTSVGSATYAWSTGSTGPSITVNSPGAYILTVTNSCGMDIDTTVVTDLGDVPIVNLGPDVSICDGDTVLLAPGSTGAYLWNDGSTANTFDITKPGQLILTVTNACGATSDTVNVTMLDAIPALDLGVDTSICPGDQVVFAPGFPNVNYQWSNGSTGQTLTTGAAGQVILNISNTCGSVADTVSIALLPAAPVLNLGSDFSICPGEVVQLSPGLTGVSYQWNDGSTANTYSVTDVGQVILTVSNSCGMSTDTVMVTEDPDGPSLSLGSDISVCEGETVVVAPGINGVQYLWQDGSTGPAFTATTTTLVILQITNACGVARDTLEVVISGTPPVVDLSPDRLLCDNETVVLSVDGTGNTVLWQDGSSATDYQVNVAGVYSVMLSNACGSVEDSIVIQTDVSPQPFDLGMDQVICPGEQVVLTAPSISPGSTLEWSDGSFGNTLVADGAGSYSLTITNACGLATDGVTIQEDLNVITTPTPDRFEICDGEKVTLNAQQTFSATYIWSTGAQAASIEVGAVGTYALTVTSDCDELTAEILVEEGDCGNPNVFIPNVFSPNGDGSNDVFRIDLDASDVTDFQVFIYDRWGEVVFGSNDTGFAWEGDYLHKPLQPGVYVYYFKLTRDGSRTEVYKGDVTLVR